MMKLNKKLIFGFVCAISIISVALYCNTKKVESQILILFGPPASGKGTLSNMIKNSHLNVVHISSGDLLRNTNDENIKKMMSQGEFISDEIINQELITELHKHPQGSKFILDGYPRNVNQIKILLNIIEESFDIKMVRAVVINCNADILLQNLLKRIASSEIKRADDDPEVLLDRIQKYEQSTMPAVQYAREYGLNILDIECNVDVEMEKARQFAFKY